MGERIPVETMERLPVIAGRVMPAAKVRTRVNRLSTLLRLRRDAGMTTAEYAVGTLAAVAFAGVLLKVLTSPSVQSALQAIINRALK